MWQEYPFLNTEEMQREPVVGISACLFGEAVRYDGSHRKQPSLLRRIEGEVRLLALCPEVAAGLGVPRPPVHLVDEGRQLEAVGIDNHELKVTDPLAHYADTVVSENYTQAALEDRLCGYIFKSRSPSCGLDSTPVFKEGSHVHFADGIFAHSIRRALPWLPVMEEEDLAMKNRIDAFLLLSYLVKDFYVTTAKGGSVDAFIAHHAALLEVLPKAVMRSRKISSTSRADEDRVRQQYLRFSVLMKALRDVSPKTLLGLRSNR